MVENKLWPQEHSTLQPFTPFKSTTVVVYQKDASGPYTQHQAVHQQPCPELVSFVTGHTDKTWRPVPIEDIAYFESYQKKTWFYTNEGVYTTCETLHWLEDKLPPAFVRIHRSYIINIFAIDHIARDISSPFVITLSLPQIPKLPVSQSYVKQVRDKLRF